MNRNLFLAYALAALVAAGVCRRILLEFLARPPAVYGRGGRCLIAENGQRLPGPRRAGLRPCTLVNFIDVCRGNAFLRNYAAQVQP